MDGKPQILQTVVSIGGKLDPSLMKAMGKASGALGGLSKSIGGLAVKGGIAGLLGAAGKSWVDASKRFSDATRVLIKGTGATGKALADLQASYQSLLRGSSVGSDVVANQIADINTLLGLSGEKAVELGRHLQDLGKAVGEDIGELTRAYGTASNAWGLTPESAEANLNYLRKVSKLTGMASAEILRSVTEESALLQSQGLDFRSASLFLANLKKQGVRSGDVLSAMKKAAQRGSNFADVIYSIQQGGGMEMAATYFGESAAKLMQAVDSGRLSISEANKQLRYDFSTLEDDARSMETASDIFARIKNKLSASVGGQWEDTTKMLAQYLEWVIDGGWEDAWNSWSKTVTKPIDYIFQLFERMTMFEERLKYNVSEFFGLVWDKIKAIGSYIDETVLSPIVRLINRINNIGGGFTNIVKKTTGIDLPQFATGGFTHGPSIAGEAGQEAVLSFNPAYRNENLQYWAEAGRRLGVGGNSYDFSGMVFSPTINADNSAQIMEGLKRNQRDFADMVIGAIDSYNGRRFN